MVTMEGQECQLAKETEPEMQESEKELKNSEDDERSCNKDVKTERVHAEKNCAQENSTSEDENKCTKPGLTFQKSNDNDNDKSVQNEESASKLVAGGDNTIIAIPVAVSENSVKTELSGALKEQQNVLSRTVQLQNPTFVTKQLIFVKKIMHTKQNPSLPKLAALDQQNVPIPSNADESSNGFKRKRDKSVTNGAIESSDSTPPDHAEPLNKRRRNLKNDGSFQELDRFCWVCHRDGIVIGCATCPRVYHLRCVQLENSPSEEWVCPECITILNAENVETRSRAMRQLSLDQLCNLLKYALHRMKAYPGTEPFCKPVDQTMFPRYREFVAHPMDLSQLERNIRRRMYGSTEAFIADTKWILHDCIIFNTHHTKLSSTAKAILKICKQEMSEIEICPDCYLNAHTRKDSWFIEVCRKPHVLLWAKLKGFPFWPAKVMRTNRENMVDVRFFGAHDRAWVPVRDCFLYSKCIPTIARNKKKHNLEACVNEVELHIKKLRERFGHFDYASFRTPFDPAREEEHLATFLPRYAGENAVSQMPFQHRFRPRILRKTSDKSSFSDPQSHLGGFRVTSIRTMSSVAPNLHAENAGTSADEGDDENGVTVGGDCEREPIVSSVGLSASARHPSSRSSIPVRPLRVYGRRRPSPSARTGTFDSSLHSTSTELKTEEQFEPPTCIKREPEDVEPSKIGSASLSDWARFEMEAARITMSQRHSSTSDADAEESAPVEILDIVANKDEQILLASPSSLISPESPPLTSHALEVSSVSSEPVASQVIPAITVSPASPNTIHDIAPDENESSDLPSGQSPLSLPPPPPPLLPSKDSLQSLNNKNEPTFPEKADRPAPSGESDMESLNITEDDTSSLSSASESAEQEIWARMTEVDEDDSKEDSTIGSAAPMEITTAGDSEDKTPEKNVTYGDTIVRKRPFDSDSEDSNTPPNVTKTRKISVQEFSTSVEAVSGYQSAGNVSKLEDVVDKKKGILPDLIRRLHGTQPHMYKAPPPHRLKVGTESSDSDDKDDSNLPPEGEESDTAMIVTDYGNTNSPVGGDSNSNSSLTSSSSSESASTSSSSCSSSSSNSNNSSSSNSSNSSNSDSTSAQGSNNSQCSDQKQPDLLSAVPENQELEIKDECKDTTTGEHEIVKNADTSEAATSLSKDSKVNNDVLCSDILQEKRSHETVEDVRIKEFNDIVNLNIAEGKESVDENAKFQIWEDIKEEDNVVNVNIKKDELPTQGSEVISNEVCTTEEKSIKHDHKVENVKDEKDKGESEIPLLKSDNKQIEERKDKLLKDEKDNKDKSGTLLIEGNETDLRDVSENCEQEKTREDMKQSLKINEKEPDIVENTIEKEKKRNKQKNGTDKEVSAENEKYVGNDNHVGNEEQTVGQNVSENEEQTNVEEETCKDVSKDVLKDKSEEIEMGTEKDNQEQVEKSEESKKEIKKEVNYETVKQIEIENENQKDSMKTGQMDKMKENLHEDVKDNEKETKEIKKDVKAQNQRESKQKCQREVEKESMRELRNETHRESEKDCKRTKEQQNKQEMETEKQNGAVKESQKIPTKGNLQVVSKISQREVENNSWRESGKENQSVAGEQKEKIMEKENQRASKLSSQESIEEENKVENEMINERNEKEESIFMDKKKSDNDEESESILKDIGGTDKRKLNLKGRKGDENEDQTILKEKIDKMETDEKEVKGDRRNKNQISGEKGAKDDDQSQKKKKSDLKVKVKRKTQDPCEIEISSKTKELNKKLLSRKVLLPSLANRSQPEDFLINETDFLENIKQEPMDVEEDEFTVEEDEHQAESAGTDISTTVEMPSKANIMHESALNDDDRDYGASPASLTDKDNVLPSYLYPSVTITVDNDKRVETSGPSVPPCSEGATCGAGTQGDGTINIEEVKASVGLPSAISLSVIAASSGGTVGSNKESSSGGSESLVNATSPNNDSSEVRAVSVPTIVTTPSGLTVTAHNGLQISTQPAPPQPPPVIHNQGEISPIVTPIRSRARKSFPNRPHPQVKITNGPGKGLGNGRRGSSDTRRGSFSSLTGDVTVSPNESSNPGLGNGGIHNVNGDHNSGPARSGAPSMGAVHHQAVTQANGRLLPHLQPRPLGQPGASLQGAKCNGTVPAEAGPISQEICNHAQKMAGYMQQAVEEMLRDMSNSGNLEASTKMLQLELEKVHWRYQQEIAELKHNTDLLLVEMRASMMSEQQRAVAEAVRQCEIEKQRAIEETKKKQWCTSCGKEALFYCCWNTSYCDYPCQQRHWPQHMASCGQAESMKAREAAENGLPQSTGPAAALVHHAPSSKGFAAGSQMAVPTVGPPSGKGISPAGVQSHRPRGPTPPYGLMPMPRPPMQVVGRAQPASSTTAGIVASSNITTTTSTSATTSCVAFVHTPVNSGPSPVILCHVSGRATTGGTCVATTTASTIARIPVPTSGSSSPSNATRPTGSTGSGTSSPNSRTIRSAPTTLLHLRPMVAPVVRLPLP